MRLLNRIYIFQIARYLASALLFTIFLTGCVMNGVGSGGNLSSEGLSRLSNETFSSRELSTQDKALKQNYGGVYKSKSLQNYLTSITEKLWVSAGVKPPSQAVVVLDTPAINAFSLPGGRLYVTRGLVALANDEAEIVSVLAHEIAHVLAKHASQRVYRRKQVQMVQKVVNDVVKDEKLMTLSTASSEADLIKFTQSQELEADQLGLTIAKGAGYDAAGAMRFLKSLKQMMASQSRGFVDANGRQAGFFGSHPPTTERINAVQKQLSLLPRDGSKERQRFLGQIDGLRYGNEPDHGIVINDIFYHSALGIGFKIPAGYNVRNTSIAVFLANNNGQMLRFDVDRASGFSDLDDYVRNEWIKEGDITDFSSYQKNGFEYAKGKTYIKGWTFHLTAIRDGSQLFRFVMAQKGRLTGSTPKAIEEVTGSVFRLTSQNKKQLRARAIRILKTNKSMSENQILSQMDEITDKRQIFKIINGLETDRNLSELDFVKIIKPENY